MLVGTEKTESDVYLTDDGYEVDPRTTVPGRNPPTTRNGTVLDDMSRHGPQPVDGPVRSVVRPKSDRLGLIDLTLKWKLPEETRVTKRNEKIV